MAGHPLDPDTPEIQSRRQSQAGRVQGSSEGRRARRRADALAADARDLIRFAMLAIDDAELALLEALEAEAHAESLADSD